ncbi:MAG: hypothetical protein SGARI_000850, partial [Bacillariaceae sp.]
IVALWIVLEKTSGALFGAPLVGYLTDRMLNENNPSTKEEYDNVTKSTALAYNLFVLSSAFWGACAFFWTIMLVSMHNGGNKTGNNKAKGSASARISSP